MALYDNDITNKLDTSIENLPEEYVVKITASSLITPPVIKAAMPEQFDLSAESDYAQAFPGGAASFVDEKSRALGNLMRLNGYNMMTKEMSLQVWQGSSPMTFSLPLEFVAENDPYTEVTLPIANLYKLTVPRTVGDSGGFLRAPGPTIDVNFSGLKDAAGDILAGDISKAISVRDNIKLELGKHLVFKQVVIPSVSQSYNVQYAKGGQPIRATVTINFITLFTPTSTDIDEIFQLDRGQRVPGSSI